MDDAVTPQEKKLQASLSADFFEEPQKIKTYFDTIDKMASFADENIEKQPVTTEKACRSLMKSMDRTEEALVKLLNSIVWPFLIRPP